MSADATSPTPEPTLRIDSEEELERVLVSGYLRIAVSRLAEVDLKLEWTGRSDGSDAVQALSPFLADVVEEAQDQGALIEMHFEKLDHFDSPTISALIQLIRRAREKRVHVLMYFDGEARWQQLSFDALGIFEDPDGFVRFQPITGSTRH